MCGCLGRANEARPKNQQRAGPSACRASSKKRHWHFPLRGFEGRRLGGREPEGRSSEHDGRGRAEQCMDSRGKSSARPEVGRGKSSACTGRCCVLRAASCRDRDFCLNEDALLESPACVLTVL